jgi:site-specific DNA recombinase
MSKTNGKPRPQAPLVRCAVYTRKSTEEGLDLAFNSLDAQRESAEAFVASQRHEGWACLPQRYDDGGFTGGNLDRPALRRLLADIEAGRVDCVVVYKVDRLSRSLLDFARLMESFEKHRVAFVSVTQQFNTGSSMGRLVLNVLLSFAQFEREIISERTRDKIAATRRKGKWSGGRPVLGYDVDRERLCLVVNEEEAARVRAIFALYLKHEALLPVVRELERRGWRNKRWTTRAGEDRGGERFTKTGLHRLLTNVLYAGRVGYKGETHPGEHPAIVEPAVWERVQAVLRQNARTGGARVRNRFGALLKGLLRCVPCGCAMVPTHTTRKGNKRYRYYVCAGAQKRGWHTCPSKAVPAGEIERFVVDQIRCIGRDPALRDAALREASRQGEERRAELEAEQRGLEKDLARWHQELQQAAAEVRPGSDSSAALARLADVQERIARTQARADEIRGQIESLCRDALDEGRAAAALAAFDPVWEALTPKEQSRLLELLVQRVDYDGARGKVAVVFHATGIQALHDQLDRQPVKEKIA